MAFENGQIVEVTDCFGKRLRRRVIEDRGKLVVVCAEIEFGLAKTEDREPAGIGFPAESVRPLESTRQV